MRKAALLCGMLSLAVFVSFYLLPESVLLPAAGVCALLSALSLLLPRGKGRARAHLALLGAAIGLFAFFVQEHFLAAPSDALAGEKRVISVRVTDYPDIYDTSEYITVRVRDPDLPGVKCRIASYDTENFTALTPGDELSVPVKLLPARERNGQSVDTYAAQGIFLRATATGAPEITGRWDFSFLYAPKALCRAIGEICRSVFPPDVQPFLTALLTGDKTDLYDDGAHYYALADAGLAHVVAVSGMHIAFLMGFLFLLIGRRPWAVAVSLPVLLLFAAMTGFTPSVTRAAVMQFFLLAAPLFGRESDGVTSLLTALALLLLLNPSACASVSLQLSFSSVAGIWFLSDRMYRTLSRRIEDLKIAENRHVLLFAAGSVSSSIGAMALSAPLTAVHFGSVSVVSPISNILCLWIVSAVYIGGYIIVLLGALVVFGGVLFGCARELNAFAVGEDNARHIGVNVRRVKLTVMIAVSALIGVCVSVGGTIGFVGLVTPHMVRLITGPNHRRLLPASAFGGAIFLMLCDLLARTLFEPRELPVGVVTSFIGSILFVVIFIRTRRGEK